MPRIPNIRPTSIYWLFDVRPETLAQHPNGWPFYCGKTVAKPEKRFAAHYVAARRYPDRLVSIWFDKCGPHIRLQNVEIVPISDDWISRERFWITAIRTSYPGGANISDGGQGVAGVVRSAETRAKMSQSKIGKKRSEETRAKIGAAHKNRIFSDEHRARLSAALVGKKRSKLSPEQRAKLRLRKGGTRSSEANARLNAAISRRLAERYG